MKPFRFVHLQKRLYEINERQFQFLLVNYFRTRGFLTDRTHGASEHGADVILTLKQNEDPLNIGQYIFIQAKAVDINLLYWRSNVQGQMLELYNRPPMLLNSDKVFSRRLALMTTKTINNEVIDEIIHWNEKMPIPVEAFDGQRLAKMLANSRYTIRKLNQDILQPSIAIPIEQDIESPSANIVGQVSQKVNARPMGKAWTHKKARTNK